jgi:hypothetical protein
MSTNAPEQSCSPLEKSIALSENVPKSIGTSEKVIDGLLSPPAKFTTLSLNDRERQDEQAREDYRGK